MPQKRPVYRIPDFTAAKALARGFHIVDLQTHREKHAFVQALHKHDFYLLLHVAAGKARIPLTSRSIPSNPTASIS